MKMIVGSSSPCSKWGKVLIRQLWVVANNPHKIKKNHLKPTSAASFHATTSVRKDDKSKGKNVDAKDNKPKEPKMNSSTIAYVEDMYNAWLRNPKSVESSWDAYFRTVTPPTPTASSSSPGFNVVPTAGTAPHAQYSPSADSKIIDDHLAVQAIIRSYQSRGHLAADLDPLQLIPREKTVTNDGFARWANENVLRQHTTYTFGAQDLDRSFKLPSTTFIGGDQKELPLREILLRLENVYCNKIGLEYLHIPSIDLCNWIRQKFEPPNAISFTPKEKTVMMERLARASGLEMFLQKKYSSEKRFGLEGCEALIPCLKEIIDTSSLQGTQSVIVGMAHRGRLNVLANVARKPLEAIFTQFAGLKASDSGSGDVKYHLGTYSSFLNRSTDKEIRFALIANASHLESVNAIVLGRARAEQHFRGDCNGRKILPILIHGDASFCGQGIVYECMHLSHLPKYTTHGTINVVINNQIGFTTDPRLSRSSPYCTDVGRVVEAPIFHVNADDIEAVVHVSRVAALWRATFHKDVVIDLVSYRRNGHNEVDEPMFTQPFMYKKIRQHKPVLELFSQKLINEGVATQEDVKKVITSYDKLCETAFNNAKNIKSTKYSEWIDSPWHGFFEGKDILQFCPTGVSFETLLHIGEKFSSPPKVEEFVIHSGIVRILQQRKEMVEKRIADWALGEALAIGSLLKEGIHVRFSGQDVERGTFAHRHHVLHHQTRDKGTYIALEHLYPDQATYVISNSSLSEAAVLGFEHGYSMSNPQCLIIWEAQFGDFVNTAQCILDQYIAAGETKWVRQSGIVLLLPHAMEGNGPEHSSGRMERFLEMCSDDPDSLPQQCEDVDRYAIKQLYDINWIIVNLTTPANLFHVLRRQIKLAFRKPLIIFTPKSLLRHPEARSKFCDMGLESKFLRLKPDDGPAASCPELVCKLIFCSGHIYYDLKKARDDREAEKEIAIVRVEQIAPFPYDLVAEQLCKYKGAELIWAQEEHKNQGAWNYVSKRFCTVCKSIGDSRQTQYVGRPPSAAPSTGNKAQHYQEFNNIIIGAFGKLTPEQIEKLAEKQKKMQEEAKLRQAAAKKEKAPAPQAKKPPPKPTKPVPPKASKK